LTLSRRLFLYGAIAIPAAPAIVTPTPCRSYADWQLEQLRSIARALGVESFHQERWSFVLRRNEAFDSSVVEGSLVLRKGDGARLILPVQVSGVHCLDAPTGPSYRSAAGVIRAPSKDYFSHLLGVVYSL
jgi:hypothetical protein